MDRLAEIDARLDEIADQLELIERDSQPDSLPADSVQRSQRLDDLAAESDELIGEARALRDEAQPLKERTARRARIGEYARSGGLVERGDAGGRATDPSVISRAKTQAFEGLDRVQSLAHCPEGELAQRAEGALAWLKARGCEGAEGTLAPFLDPLDADSEVPLDWQRVQRARASELMVVASSPEYTRAWWKIIRNPQADHTFDLSDSERLSVQRARSLSRTLDAGDPFRWGDEQVQRAALSLTNANGGYLVPFTLDPSIVLSNAGSANPWRGIANLKRTATNTWNGVVSSGVNAQWLAEATVVADASPTFSNIQITPQKASAWVWGSYEILEDSDFETELPGLLADAKDRLESTAFAVGTGSGQPFGAITRATATAIAGGVITVAGLLTVHAALSPRFRGSRPNWLANVSALDAMRILPVSATAGSPMVLSGSRMSMWDEPASEASDMDGTISTGGHKVVCYMDGNQYLIVDRIGMTVLYEPMIKDPTTGRPTGQGGWFAMWRTGADASFGASSAAIRVLSLT